MRRPRSGRRSSQGGGSRGRIAGGRGRRGRGSTTTSCMSYFNNIIFNIYIRGRKGGDTPLTSYRVKSDTYMSLTCNDCQKQNMRCTARPRNCRPPALAPAAWSRGKIAETPETRSVRTAQSKLDNRTRVEPCAVGYSCMYGELGMLPLSWRVPARLAGRGRRLRLGL